MRLFIALKIDDVIANTIDKWQEDNKVPGKRVKKENLHFTLCFLGERPESDLDSLKEILTDTLKDTKNFTISLQGLGVLPRITEPRVLYIDVDEGKEALVNLAKQISQAIPFYEEKKPFKPHLTISRLKDYQEKPNLDNLWGKKDCYSFGSFKATEVILFSSDLRPSGPIYTPRAICPLVD